MAGNKKNNINSTSHDHICALARTNAHVHKGILQIHRHEHIHTLKQANLIN